MPLTILLGAKKAISSIKNSAIISGFCSSFFSNIPLRYIMNKIGDIGDPYDTPEFVSFNEQVNSSITS
jgi:Na+/H+ antiporter NhaD/arsenite permease-like protein